jgi:hypothetical protein
LFNHLKHFGGDAERVLQPGERLLDLGLYHEPLAGDESRLARTTDELSPRMRRQVDEHGAQPPPSEKLVEGFDPTIGGLQVNQSRIDRLLGGLSGAGAADSVAGQWWRAVKGRAQRWDTTEYAVTDRRLLLLTSRTRGAGNTEYKIMHEVPRRRVSSAVRRGKWLFQRGRVEVRFTDGSMIAWSAGLLSTRRAHALVAALAGPGVQTGED